MNEKPSKEYKKYLIVPTEIYEKMHSGMINESRLSVLERKMLGILRDPKYSTTQRLKFYQQLLMIRMKPEAEKKKVSHEMSTQTDNYDNDPFKFNDVAVGDELRRFSTPLKAFKNPNINDVFITPEANFPPPNPEEYFDGSPPSLNVRPTRKLPAPYRRLKKISYQESEDDGELDVNKERLYILNELKRQSSSPFTNLDDFDFKDLEEETKPYFTAINKKTKEQFLVEKSDAVQKKLNSRTKKNLSKSSIETKRLTSDLVSPPKSRSGKQRLWNAYK